MKGGAPPRGWGMVSSPTVIETLVFEFAPTENDVLDDFLAYQIILKFLNGHD